MTGWRRSTVARTRSGCWWPTSRDRTGRSTDVVRRMEIVRLGQGVDRTGRLASRGDRADPGRAGRLCRADRGARRERVRMVATSATRDAANADEFRAMVADTLGVAPEVVTGARGGPAVVHRRGARATRRHAERRSWWSTSAAAPPSSYSATGNRRDAVSVDIGCVRMTERHLRDDPPTAAQILAAEADITAVVDRALAVVPGHTAGTLIGLAGSVTTVTALALGLDSYRPERIHHARVSYADVAAGDQRAAGDDSRRAAGMAGDAPRSRGRDRGGRVDPAHPDGARRSWLGGGERARHSRRHRLQHFQPRVAVGSRRPGEAWVTPRCQGLTRLSRCWWWPCGRA